MNTFLKKNLPIPTSAKTIHRGIVKSLKNLINCNLPSPLHPDFISAYEEILKRFHQFQNEVIRNYGKKVSCKKGCTYCCLHWVEDVYSFEAEIIADYTKKNFPKRVNTIIKRFQEDEEELVRLNDIMEQKLIENQEDKKIASIDTTDLLLDSFYQIKRKCAFLSDDRTCIIYKVRPLTCRIYVSFSDPEFCSPECINISTIPTYLLDLEESASRILDDLHERYNRYNKSGLRTLLIDYLRNDNS